LAFDVVNRLPRNPIAERIRANRWAAQAAAEMWYVVVAAAVTFVTWQQGTLLATSGLDPSWMAALHFAHVHGIGFGSSFVWTYGPLGYLAFPIAVTSSTLLQAFVFTVVSQFMLCYLLCRAATRTMRLLAPAVVLLVAVMPLLRPDVLVMVVLVASVALLQAAAPSLWALLLTSAVAGAAALVKTNSGLTALAIVVVAAWARKDLGERRWAAVPAAVGTTMVLWLWTGNSFLELGPWLRLSGGIVGGYAAAMQSEDVTIAWQYPLAGIVSVVLLGSVLALTRREPWRIRVALPLMLAGFLFAFFKEAFIRHDIYHGPYFFGAVATAVGAVTWRGATKLAAIAVLITCLQVVRWNPGLRFHPVASAGHLGSQIADVTDNARRGELVRRSKADERAVYQLPQPLLARLRGHTVHVDPYETATIGAYALAWRPLPVVQSYSAYTSALDEAQARALTSDQAPQRILVEAAAFTVSGRKRELSAPATFHAMICSYRQVAVSARWQVLARTMSRCDPGQFLLERVTVHAGVVVPVPKAPPRSLVLLRIDVHQGIWNRIRGLAYKPRVPIVKPGGQTRVLLVPGTATDGIVVRIPPKLRPVAGFEGERSWPSVQVTDAGIVTYEFLAQRLR
jgi:hypothetical protein